MKSSYSKNSYGIIICGLTCVMLFLHTTSFGQEQLGMRLETYAGTGSLTLNPSAFLSGDLGWDFQLGGIGAFLANNYAFVENAGLFRFINNRDQMTWALALNSNPPREENAFLVNFFDGSSNRFLHLNSFIAGPSLVTRLSGNKSLGIFTNLRIAGNSFNIPAEFSYFPYNNRPFQQPFAVQPWDASVMSWLEVGIHYGWEIKGNDQTILAGINLKYVQGYESAYISNRSDYIHTKWPDNNLSLENPHFRFGFTQIPESRPFSQRNGNGLGIDLGVSQILFEDRNGYILKAGISLMDLGFIRFNRNSQNHHLNLDTTLFMRWEDYENVRYPFELEEAVQILNSRSLEGSHSTFFGDQYLLALPSAFSLQLDYKMSNHIYLNSLLIQNLSFIGPGPQRANLLAFTPRWQNHFFSVSAPISVFHWSKVHLGLAARFGGLIIGSDHLHGLFNRSDFSGMDFYVSLKLQSWMFGSKKEGLFSKSRSGIECFEF